MFDNIICYNDFFKRVTDCKTVGSGIKSYHSDISVTFKLTHIKLNISKADLMVIDWQKYKQTNILKKILMRNYISP